MGGARAAFALAVLCGAAIPQPARAGARPAPDASILIVGQSNAFYLIRDGGPVLRAMVERLLGFDGVTHRVAILGGAAQTTWSASGLMPRAGLAARDTWLAGSAESGWRPGALEAAFDAYLHGLPESARAGRLVILWLHNETDSLDPAATPARWESAVRFAAADARAALGRRASDVPLDFAYVPFDYYGAMGVSGRGRGVQVLKQGYARLAADPAVNAHEAAQLGDSDMDGPPGRPGVYGGFHAGPSDLRVWAGRLALTIATQWAGLARPGAPVAVQGGHLHAVGPCAVSARREGADGLVLRVADHAALAPLSDAARAGAGWAVVRGKQVLHGVAAMLRDGALDVRFSAALPEGGRLFYGYESGRIFPGPVITRAPDLHLAAGRGAAVYDTAGLPLWLPAEGLAY